MSAYHLLLKFPPMKYTPHWAKNRGQKDINSKIVEKSKIMNLLDGVPLYESKPSQIFLLQILAIFS